MLYLAIKQVDVVSLEVDAVILKQISKLMLIVKIISDKQLNRIRVRNVIFNMWRIRGGMSQLLVGKVILMFLSLMLK